MSQAKIHLSCPFSKDIAKTLKAGDQVVLSGTIISARDAAHKRLYNCLINNQELPINLKETIIYYVGPSPAREHLPIGSAGPTTSGRMDPYTPKLIEYGIHGMIGKGYRSQEVIEAIKKYQVPYFVTLGGAGALIAKSIKSYTVLAYDDLGAEAIAKIEVQNFPAIVAIDTQGNNYYEIGQKPYQLL